MKEIMLLFLSRITTTDKDKTTGENYKTYEYVDNAGYSYEGVQTNEPAIYSVEKGLRDKGKSLDKVFYFASEEVRTKPLVSLGSAQSGTDKQLTSEEFFRYRLRQKYPNILEKLVSISYDEQKKLEESLHTVIQMATAIRNYVENQNKEEVRLYVDMTGGFRHSTMMMLSVMQLLKHSHLSVEMLLYSDFAQKRVEDSTEIHHMMELISGIDSFVNFGSASDMQRYFSYKPESNSPELKALLKAMDSFSNAIKVCHTSRIQSLVQELLQAITHFKNLNVKPVREKLFEQIITLLEREYGLLFKEQGSAVAIIRWCANKGFLQQAMTLCTELLPVEIVKHHICYVTDEAIQAELKRKSGNGLKGAWEKIFIANYLNEIGRKVETELQQEEGNKGWNLALSSERKELTKRIRSAIVSISNGDGGFSVDIKNFPKEFREPLRQLLEEIKGVNIELCLGNIKSLQDGYPYLTKFYRQSWGRKKKATTYKESEQSHLNKTNIRKVLNDVNAFTLEDYVMILGITLPKSVENMKSTTSNMSSTRNPAVNKDTLEEKRSDERSKIARIWSKDGIVTDYPKGESEEILISYGEIRYIRNNINHATGVNTEEIDVKEKVLKCLDEFEMLIFRHKNQ